MKSGILDKASIEHEQTINENIDLLIDKYETIEDKGKENK